MLSQLHIFLLFFVQFIYSQELSNSEIPVDITLPAFSSECVYYDLTSPDQQLDIRYQVLYGGNFEIDFQVSSPSGQVVIEEKQRKFGEFILQNVGLGSYKFCLSNTYGTDSKKVEFFFSEYDEFEGQHDEEDPDDILALNSVQEISRSLDKTRKLMDYLRAREWRNLYTVESTQSRLVWYSITIVIIMATISLGQSFIIQFFFKKGQRY